MVCKEGISLPLCKPDFCQKSKLRIWGLPRPRHRRGIKRDQTGLRNGLKRKDIVFLDPKKNKEHLFSFKTVTQHLGTKQRNNFALGRIWHCVTTSRWGCSTSSHKNCQTLIAIWHHDKLLSILKVSGLLVLVMQHFCST